LADALDKNKEATKTVKRAADDLAVVHAVLETKIAKAASDDDVKRAVEETNKVERRLGDPAESWIRSTKPWSARYDVRHDSESLWLGQVTGMTEATATQEIRRSNSARRFSAC
jgi:hypothetical protein